MLNQGLYVCVFMRNCIRGTVEGIATAEAKAIIFRPDDNVKRKSFQAQANMSHKFICYECFGVVKYKIVIEPT